MLKQSFNSLDLARADYFLFPELKSDLESLTLEENHFNSAWHESCVVM
jgi:hypothetical protein